MSQRNDIYTVGNYCGEQSDRKTGLSGIPDGTNYAACPNPPHPSNLPLCEVDLPR